MRPPFIHASQSSPSTVIADAHCSVATARQPYLSRRSSNKCCLLEKSRSPVILTIDRTAAYSDRQPRSCSMTSPPHGDGAKSERPPVGVHGCPVLCLLFVFECVIPGILESALLGA